MMKLKLLITLGVIFALFALVAAGTNNWTPEALADEIKGGLPDAPAYSRQFSGYITIRENTHLFYYLSLVPDETKAINAPVVFWTSGGPGCSGLIGAFSEMGAYQPVPDGKGGVKLALRAQTPNDEVNMLYIEQPDVGYTYIDEGYAPNEWRDADVAERNAEFIFEWFKRFNNLKGNKFAIWSESYGGHYIPTLERALIKHNAISELNFHHALVGNPLTYIPWNDAGAYILYIERNIIPWYTIGEPYFKNCWPDPTKTPNPPEQISATCDVLQHSMDHIINSLIDPYAMSFPVCTDPTTGQYRFRNLHEETIYTKIHNARAYAKNQTHMLTPQQRMEALKLLQKEQKDQYAPINYQECESDYTTTYLNRPDVIKSFGASLRRTQWSMCENLQWNNYDFIDNMIPIWKDNWVQSKGQVRQLIYSGTDDTVCSTAEISMGLFGSGQYKVTGANWEPVEHKGQLIGYKSELTSTESTNRETEISFVTIHGAGHMCPQTRPEHTKTVVLDFLNDKF